MIRPVPSRSRIYMGSTEAFGQHPQLAVMIAEIIALWAEIDHAMGTIFSIALGTDAPLAIQLYIAIESEGPRASVMKSGLRARLNEELALRAAKLLDKSRTKAKDRHKLAHGLWGMSPDHPNCLVLGDPRMALLKDSLPTEPTTADQFLTKMPYDHIPGLMIYDKPAFELIFKEALSVYGKVIRLTADILKFQLLQAPS